MAEPSAARHVPSTEPLVERRRGVLVIRGSIEPADVGALCERARPLLVDLAAIATDPLVCDVRALRANLPAVDAIARLALSARRLDRGVRLHDAQPALRELLGLAGLARVVRCDPNSGLDPGR